MKRQSAPAILILLLAAVAGACGGEDADAIRFVAVSAGRAFSCALTDRGAAYCWGDNQYGVLGTGDTVPRTVPTRVATGRALASIAAGFHHTCALALDGTAFCWGGNGNGALGDGTTTDRSLPTQVTGGLTFVQISAGEGHTCGRATDGYVWCWGAPLGPDGDGQLPSIATRPERLTRFAAVSAGFEIACGLTEIGAAYCWGQRPPGVLLPEDHTTIGSPQPVAGTVVLAEVSVGHKHACGLDAAGQAYCWGLNSSGQVGDGTTADRTAPVAIQPGARFTRISAHAPQHTCGVTAAGAVSCWGANGVGQLGDGTTTGRTLPTEISASGTFVDVSVGFAHTCAATTDGRVLCWGYGGRGQLGDGTTDDRPVPAEIQTPG